MSKRIDISVLIPIYGVERHIERSLRSMFSQTKTEGVEFILVNDCTRDRSMVIVQELLMEFEGLDIHIINHPHNRGIAAARQSAIDVARGEYIAFFDSDDWCESDMLEMMHQCAITSDADIVVCDYFLSRTDREFYDAMPTPNNGKDALTEMLWGRVYWVLWNKLIRRELFNGSQMDMPEGINYGEDLLMCTKLFARARHVEYLPKAFVHYMQVSGATTSNINSTKLENVRNVVQLMEEFLEENNLAPQMQEALRFRKFETKLFLLNGSNGKAQRGYAKLYPEITGSIMGEASSPKYVRYTLLLASKGMLLPFNMLRWLRGRRHRGMKNNKY